MTTATSISIMQQAALGDTLPEASWPNWSGVSMHFTRAFTENVSEFELVSTIIFSALTFVLNYIALLF